MIWLVLTALILVVIAAAVVLPSPSEWRNLQRRKHSLPARKADRIHPPGYLWGFPDSGGGGGGEGGDDNDFDGGDGDGGDGSD